MSLLRTLFLLAVALSSAVACGGGSGGNDGGVPKDGGPDGTSDAAGGPLLSQLSLSGPGAASAFTLLPAFSPTIFDYTVPCGGGGSVSVSFTPMPGATAKLTAPSTSSSSGSMQTVKATIKENQAFVAVASKGSASNEYWVRCLPSDFPQIVTTNYPGLAPTPGWYLVSNLTLSGKSGYAMILNANGTPLWYFNDTMGWPVDVDSYKKGELSFIGDPAPTTFQVFDTLSSAPRSFGPKGVVADYHELLETPSGTFVMLSYPTVSGVDLTGITAPPPVSMALGKNETIADCEVVEFKADGTVVSTWKASDHFEPKKTTTFVDPASFDTIKSTDGGIAYDVFHCNSLDVDPKNGNYLLSGRHMDSVFYVQKPGSGANAGEVLWKLGGNPSSKDPGTVFVSFASPAKEAFFRQHDARLVAGWNAGCNGGTGQISVFDDETGIMKGGKLVGARGVIYDVIVGGGSACKGPTDVTPGHATINVEYDTANQDILVGSVRVQPDGEVVVGWGLNIGTAKILTEYNSAAKPVLDIDMLPDFSSYRAVKFPIDWFDLETMRKSAGK